MSLLGRLFGRKKGGTRVGNFIRQVAANNTIGILGKDQQRQYGVFLTQKDVSFDGVNPDL